jgi:WD40 repeat protein
VDRLESAGQGTSLPGAPQTTSPAEFDTSAVPDASNPREHRRIGPVVRSAPSVALIPPSRQMRYSAFISYRTSCSPDCEIAIALQASLEGFRVPKGIAIPTALERPNARRKLLRTFRDTTELSATFDLPIAIQTALRESSCLIVICTRNTPASTWIPLELDFFGSLVPKRPVLLLLGDGDERSSFPAAFHRLSARLPTGRPWWASQRRSVRWTSTTPSLAADIRAPTPRKIRGRLGTEKMRLLAAILGCSFDDLAQRTFRRARRLLLGLVALGLGVAMAMGALAIWAVLNAKATERERLLGLAREGILYLEQNRAAEARTSLLSAMRGLSGSAQESLWLSTAFWESSRRSPLPLLELAAATENKTGRRSGAAWLSPDGRRELHCDGGSQASFSDLITGTTLWTIDTSTPVARILLTPDEKIAIGVSTEHSVVAWEIPSGRRLWSHAEPTAWRGQSILGPELGVDGDGKLLVVGSVDGAAKVIDTRTGQVLQVLKTREPDDLEHPQPMNVAVTPDGRWVLTELKREGATSTAVQIWERESGKQVASAPLRGWINDLAVSQHNDMVAVLSADAVTLVSVPTGKELSRIDINKPALPSSSDVASEVDLADHTVSVRSFFGVIRIYEQSTGSLIGTWEGSPSPFVTHALDASGEHLFTLAHDGTRALWTVRGTHAAPETFSGGLDSRLDPEGRWVLIEDDQRRLTLYDSATLKPLRSYAARVGNGFWLSPAGDVLAIMPHSGRIDVYDFKGNGRRVSQLGDIEWQGKRWTFTPYQIAADHKSAVGSLHGGPEKSVLASVGLNDSRVQWTSPFEHEELIESGTLGELLVLGQNGHIRRIRASDGSVLHEIRLKVPGNIFCGAALPDERLVSGADRDLVEMDMRSGKLLRSMPATGQVTSLAVFPGSRVVLANGGAGPWIHTWDLDSGRSLLTLSVSAAPGRLVMSRSGTLAAVGAEIWRIGRAREYAELAEAVPAAQKALSRNASDRQALLTLGRWFSFRGDSAWSVEFLDKAAAAGASLDALLLGRQTWKAGLWSRAEMAYTEALRGARTDDDRFYLASCLAAVRNRGPVKVGSDQE